MHSQKVTELYFMIIKENTSGGQTVLFSLLNMLKQSTRKQCNNRCKLSSALYKILVFSSIPEIQKEY